MWNGELQSIYPATAALKTLRSGPSPTTLTPGWIAKVGKQSARVEQ